MLCEDSGQSAETTWGLNVSYNTNDYHRRSLDDGYSIYNFTLVHEGTRTVNTAYNVSHTGLVSTEGSQVWGSGGIIIMWEGTDATTVAFGTLLWKKSKGSVTGGFELTVGPVIGIF